MKPLKTIFFIVFLPLFAFISAHKFYMSITQVTYSEKDESLQITMRIFIDDFERTLNERYGIQAKLATENEPKNNDYFIKKYLADHFHIKLNNQEQTLVYLGKEYEADVLKCYLEIVHVKKESLATILVESKLLWEVSEEQQNLVHVKVANQRKSLILTKENDKGMLNF